MTAARILNQAQAEAVYSAMCALNNVGGKLHARIPSGADAVLVTERSASNEIRVGRVRPEDQAVEVEVYVGQYDFATAYGLSIGAVPAVCSECGGRGVVDTGIGLMSCGSCPA